MNKRGRYWLFAYEKDNPKGGMNDFIFSFNTIEDFEEKSTNLITKYTYYQILDTQTNFDIDGDFGRIAKWICKNIGGDCYDEYTKDKRSEDNQFFREEI